VLGSYIGARVMNRNGNGGKNDNGENRK